MGQKSAVLFSTTASGRSFNDPETQEFISQSIGTSVYRQHSIAKQYDRDHKKTGYSIHVSETQDWIVAPHELSTLQDVLLLTPDGFFQVTKELLQTGGQKEEDDVRGIDPSEKRNGGDGMKTIEERTENARQRIEESKRQERMAARQARDAQRKKDSCRKYIIGELVMQYFPALREVDVGDNQQENRERFQELEAILALLAESPELMNQLRDKAAQRCGVSVPADV